MFSKKMKKIHKFWGEKKDKAAAQSSPAQLSTTQPPRTFHSTVYGSTTHSARPSGASGSSGGARHPSRFSNDFHPDLGLGSTPRPHLSSSSDYEPDAKVHSKPDNLLSTPWRTLDWSKRHEMRKHLRTFPMNTPDVEFLRILVHGPVGAGKSSFINSIDSIFQGCLTERAPVAPCSLGPSFTKKFKILRFNNGNYGSSLPFALCDIMGLEEGDLEGVLTNDLINVLEGYIIDDYEFKPDKPCSEKDPQFNTSPSLSDKIHCLVSVIPANTISMISEAVIDKMRAVREKASMRGIPQVVVLTKLDEISEQVAKDIKVVYRSKMIRRKMEECSNRLGIPLNCVFPVKNYRKGNDLNDEVEVLLLSALKHILNYANNHVIKMASLSADSEHSSMDHDMNLRDSERQYPPLRQQPSPANQRKPAHNSTYC